MERAIGRFEKVIMITGGTGFVSSRLVRKLVEQQEDVVVFDMSPNFKFVSDLMDRIKFVQGDVSAFDEVIDTIRKYGIEYIYHTASLLYGASERAPLRAVRVNTVGTANILEASRITDVKKVIFTSSVSAFSVAVDHPEDIRSMIKVDDDSPKYSPSAYGATKVFGELYGLWYARTHGLDFRGVRYYNVYGPGDPYAYHLDSTIIENPALGRPVDIPDPPDFAINLIYVKDAAEALIKVFNAKNIRRRVYNIGGENCTYREVASIVRKIVPNAIIRFTGERTSSSGGILFDDSPARQEVGWKPSYTLEEGIKETIDEIQNKEALYTKGVYVKDRII